jgi:hypothetical protein
VKYGIRAPTAQAVISLVPRVLACFQAAALSTGCTYEITRDNVYLELQPCTTLERYYQEHCRERWGREGYEVPERIEMSASTDFVGTLGFGKGVVVAGWMSLRELLLMSGYIIQGDVTYRVPGLHPMFLLPNAHKGEFPREYREWQPPPPLRRSHMLIQPNDWRRLWILRFCRDRTRSAHRGPPSV